MRAQCTQLSTVYEPAAGQPGACCSVWPPSELRSPLLHPLHQSVWAKKHFVGRRLGTILGLTCIRHMPSERPTHLPLSGAPLLLHSLPIPACMRLGLFERPFRIPDRPQRAPSCAHSRMCRPRSLSQRRRGPAKWCWPPTLPRLLSPSTASSEPHTLSAVCCTHVTYSACLTLASILSSELRPTTGIVKGAATCTKVPGRPSIGT